MLELIEKIFYYIQMAIFNLFMLFWAILPFIVLAGIIVIVIIVVVILIMRKN